MPSINLSEPSEQQTRWSLFSGILIWFLHLNTLNTLTAISCKWGWFSYNIAGIPGLQFVEGLITLLAILLMGVAIFLPWRMWRSFQDEKPVNNPELFRDTEEDRRSLMAFVTMLVNSFFLLFLLASFVPLMAFKTCGQA
jgi:hypothetical protein